MICRKMGGGKDPSQNVLRTLRSEIQRLSATARSETKRVDEIAALRASFLTQLANAETKRLDEQAQLRAEFSTQLSLAEAKRIDAIRAVDVNAVSVANDKATAQAVVLASQVAASAETLRSLVAATASTTAQQLTQLTTQLTDRLTSLEKTQYEGAGNKGGMASMWGYVFAIGMGVATIAVSIFAVMHH